MQSPAIPNANRLPSTPGNVPVAQRLAARARAPFQAALLTVIRDAALPPPLRVMQHIATAFAHCVQDAHLRQYWSTFNELLATLAHQGRPLDVDTKLMLSRADRIIKQLLEQGETQNGSAVAAIELAALRRRIAIDAVRDHTPLFDNIDDIQRHRVNDCVAHQPVAAAERNAEAAVPEGLDRLVGEITAYRSRLEKKIDTLECGLHALDQTIRRLHDQLRQLERDTAVRPGRHIDPRQSGHSTAADRRRNEGVFHGNGARIYDA